MVHSGHHTPLPVMAGPVSPVSPLVEHQASSTKDPEDESSSITESDLSASMASLNLSLSDAHLLEMNWRKGWSVKVS